jgi:hypothetical protein
VVATKAVAASARTPDLIGIAMGNPHRTSRYGDAAEPTGSDRGQPRRHGNTGARALPVRGLFGEVRREEKSTKANLAIGERLSPWLKFGRLR